MPKKSSKKTATASLRGTLAPGVASTLNKDYNTRMLNAGATNLPYMPQAVCFTIAELRAYLDSAEKTIQASGPVPPEQAGIAIMPGFVKNKVTYMLVATRFTEDKLTNQVQSINNVVTGIHPGGALFSKKGKNSGKSAPGEDPEPPVGDDSYDTGSVWP